MTELDNLFSEAIELAFAEFGGHRIYERSVRAGPFSLRLLIRSYDLSIQYPRSFLSHKKGLPNAHLGIIKRSELDLSHLLPEPRSKGRVFSNGRFFVALASRPMVGALCAGSLDRPRRRLARG